MNEDTLKARFCTDCRFYLPESFAARRWPDRCERPIKNPRYLIDGEPMVRLGTESALERRWSLFRKRCGPSGRYFERKENP